MSTDESAELAKRRTAAIEAFVANACRSQRTFLNEVFDRRRDYEKECGLPTLGTPPSPHDLMVMHRHNAYAARVNEVLPRESWQVLPTVFESEDAKVETAFEKAWKDLPKALYGQSWFRDENGSPIWEHLLRADIQSGIGRYGIIFLGLDDGLSPDKPAKENPGNVATRKLLYIRTFPETAADVIEYEQDRSNPRFGQPKMYDVTFNDPTLQPENGAGATGVNVSKQKVHWTRVVHLADGLGSSEVFGNPRCEPVWDNLLSLRKLLPGSAEMYWRGALPGWAVESNPNLGTDVKVNRAEMQEMFEDYGEGLERFLFFLGLSVKSMAPQVVDPTPQISAQEQAICIKLDIPLRKFKGSERGELASSQDDDDWNDTLRSRQNVYLTPRVIRPFVDRLILLGVLPVPKDGYSIDWPNLGNISKKDRAAIAVQMSNALAQYVQGQVEAAMPLAEFLSIVWDLDEREILQVMDAIKKNTDPLTLHLGPNAAGVPDDQVAPNGQQKRDPNAPKHAGSQVRKTGKVKSGELSG